MHIVHITYIPTQSAVKMLEDSPTQQQSANVHVQTNAGPRDKELWEKRLKEVSILEHLCC